jgi:hypothetical protein
MGERKESGLEKKVYIAHDVAHPGAPDELMKLVKAITEGVNVGIFGPPGVGKTLLVETAATLLGKKIEGITCMPETEMADIVGGPNPEIATDEKGKAIGIELRMRKGPLARAMEEGDIFYGDEYNKLRPTVQSALSAPLDFRKELRAKDGTVLVRRAKEGFGFVASWNPGGEYGGEEIIGYIKDRVYYKPFKDLPTDLQTRISLLSTGVLSRDDITDARVQERAIAEINGKFAGFIREGDVFVAVNNRKVKLKANDPKLKKYLCYVGKEGDKLEVKDKEKRETYENFYAIANFLKDCRDLVLYGSQGARDEVKNVLTALKASGLEPLHETYHIEPRSVRIIEPLAQDYVELMEAVKEGGLDPRELVERIIDPLIDNILQDKGHEMVAPNITWEALVRKVGELYSLDIGGEKYQMVEEKGFAEIPSEKRKKEG